MNGNVTLSMLIDGQATTDDESGPNKQTITIPANSPKNRNAVLELFAEWNIPWLGLTPSLWAGTKKRPITPYPNKNSEVDPKKVIITKKRFSTVEIKFLKGILKSKHRLVVIPPKEEIYSSLNPRLKLSPFVSIISILLFKFRLPRIETIKIPKEKFNSPKKYPDAGGFLIRVIIDSIKPGIKKNNE